MKFSTLIYSLGRKRKIVLHPICINLENRSYSLIPVVVLIRHGAFHDRVDGGSTHEIQTR